MSLADYPHLPQGPLQFPPEFIEKRQLIKLEETDQWVLIGAVDVDPALRQELQFFFDKELRFVPIKPQDLSEFLSRSLSDAGAVSEGPRVQHDALDSLAHDAPIVNLVNSLLMEGIRRHCSDIHLESLPGGARVRYRIDGVLHPSRVVSHEAFPAVSSRLKIMANLDIIERRLPQDGRLSVQLAGETLEFRISVVPLADGESIVLRLFQRQGQIPRLDALGFSPDFVDTLRRSGQHPNGLILVTGPTGSGKTTTMNSLLQELASDQVKLLTIEDPVENVLAGVNQIQTNEAIGLSFESLLRRVLRQDPDILMVGEIRDKKTAELCIRSALTGHLVLSTLHTNDALSAIPRLFNMGVEPYLLAAVLRSSAAQRLVRTICPGCREAVDPTPAQRHRLQTLGVEPVLHRGRGCPQCHGTGSWGRTAVGEIFPMDAVCEEMIVESRRHHDFVRYFHDQGRTSLADDVLRRVTAGQVTLEEMDRVVGFA